jgi:signal peptidase I
MEKQEKRLRRGNALLTAVIFLLAPIVLLSGWMLYYNLANPGGSSALGVKLLRVESESMEPALKKYSRILVYAAPFETIKEKDVITFRQQDGQLNTHRVIAAGNGVLTTQGDNCLYPDEQGVTEMSYRYKLAFRLKGTEKFYHANGRVHWRNVITGLGLPALGFAALLLALGMLSRSLRKRRPPSWRDEIFSGMRFSDRELNDPKLQEIDLLQWIDRE